MNDSKRSRSVLVVVVSIEIIHPDRKVREVVEIPLHATHRSTVYIP